MSNYLGKPDIDTIRGCCARRDFSRRSPQTQKFSNKVQGRVGLRAFQRLQAMPKAARGLKSLPKGGFEPKMSRREAALIVAIKYTYSFNSTNF